jgi:hypothetical protein
LEIWSEGRLGDCWRRILCEHLTASLGEQCEHVKHDPKSCTYETATQANLEALGSPKVSFQKQTHCVPRYITSRLVCILAKGINLIGDVKKSPFCHLTRHRKGLFPKRILFLRFCSRHMARVLSTYAAVYRNSPCSIFRRNVQCMVPTVRSGKRISTCHQKSIPKHDVEKSAYETAK